MSDGRWTADELREDVAAAGFAHGDVTTGAHAGMAADRLLVLARR